MKYFSPIITLVLCVLIVQSCQMGPSIRGSKKMASTTYAFSDFTNIDAAHVYNVEVVQSDVFSIELSYNENLQEYIDIKEKGGTLFLDLTENIGISNAKLRVKIGMPELTAIKTSGACHVYLPKFKCHTLDLDCSGASEVNGKLIGQTLNIEGTGASKFELEGEVHQANIDCTGATKIKAKNLTVLEALYVTCSGASVTTIRSEGDIDLDLSGASAFYYYGSGRIASQDVSGVATIKHK